MTPLIHACILRVPQIATITAYLGAPCMSSLAAMGHLPTDTGTLTRLNLVAPAPHKDCRGQYWCREWGKEGMGGGGDGEDAVGEVFTLERQEAENSLLPLP